MPGGGCTLPFGWVPITEVVENSSELKIYVLEPLIDWFEFDGFKSVIENAFGVSVVYEVTEGGKVAVIELERCALDYDGLEHMYTDASLQFLLYRGSRRPEVDTGNSSSLAQLTLLWQVGKNWPVSSANLVVRAPAPPRIALPARGRELPSSRYSLPGDNLPK